MTEKPQPVEVDEERPHGDPLVEQEPPPATEGSDPPVAPEAPEDTEPPQGDELTEARAAADKYLALAQRTQADFENFRKRMARENAAAVDRGVEKLAKELLPALDHLDSAIRAAEEHDAGEWVNGIRLVQEEFLTALGRVGIQVFAPIGEEFDPNEHEAMAQQPSEEADAGTVLQVYQQGYRLNGQVLRPARVVVSSGAA
jgi:molecular chaperone GrpE